MLSNFVLVGGMIVVAALVVAWFLRDPPAPSFDEEPPTPKPASKSGPPSKWDALASLPPAERAKVGQHALADATATWRESESQFAAAWDAHASWLDMEPSEARDASEVEAKAVLTAALEAIHTCIDQTEVASVCAGKPVPLTTLRAPLEDAGTWEARLHTAMGVRLRLELTHGSLQHALGVGSTADTASTAPAEDAPAVEPDDLLEAGRAAGFPIPRRLDPEKLPMVLQLTELMLPMHSRLPAEPNERAAAVLLAVAQGELPGGIATWLWPTEVISIPGAWKVLEVVDDHPEGPTMAEMIANELLETTEAPPTLAEEPWRGTLERMHWNALSGVIGAEQLAAMNVEPERDAVGATKRMAAMLVCDQWAQARLNGDPETAMHLRALILSGPMADPGVLDPDNAGRIFGREALDPSLLSHMVWTYESATALAWALGHLDDLPDTVERQDLEALWEHVHAIEGFLARAPLRPHDELVAMRQTLEERYGRRQAEVIDNPTHDAHMLRSRAGERWKALTWLLDGPEAAGRVSERMSSDVMPQA